MSLDGAECVIDVLKVQSARGGSDDLPLVFDIILAALVAIASKMGLPGWSSLAVTMHSGQTQPSRENKPSSDGVRRSPNDFKPTHSSWKHDLHVLHFSMVLFVRFPLHRHWLAEVK